MIYRVKVLLARLADAGIPVASVDLQTRAIAYFAPVTSAQEAQAKTIVDAWFAEGGAADTRDERIRNAVALLDAPKFAAAQALIIAEAAGGPACPNNVKTWYLARVAELRQAWNS